MCVCITHMCAWICIYSYIHSCISAVIIIKYQPSGELLENFSEPPGFYATVQIHGHQLLKALVSTIYFVGFEVTTETNLWTLSRLA